MSNIFIVKSEDDEKAVINMIKKAKGKKLLVSIHSLEEDDTPVDFVPRHKNECISMVKMSETVSALLNEVHGMKTDLESMKITQLRLYSKAQNDLKNLIPMGFEKTILFPLE